MRGPEVELCGSMYPRVERNVITSSIYPHTRPNTYMANTINITNRRNLYEHVRRVTPGVAINNEPVSEAQKERTLSEQFELF